MQCAKLLLTAKVGEIVGPELTGPHSPLRVHMPQPICPSPCDQASFDPVPHSMLLHEEEPKSLTQQADTGLTTTAGETAEAWAVRNEQVQGESVC